MGPADIGRRPGNKTPEDLKLKTRALFAIWACASSGSVAVADEVAAMSHTRGADVVVEKIRQLEGERDPKCHATASRLEDFIYGTRLSNEARFQKNELQKQLATAIWSLASDSARAQGLTDIPRAILGAERRKFLRYQQLGNGDWRVEIGKNSFVVNKTDKRQYSTVAYALRAILAAEQEQLLDPDSKLLPLDKESMESLKEAIDLFTLAVLQRTDASARGGDRYQISREDIQKAWGELLAGQAPAVKEKDKPSAPGKTDFTILKQIIAQKMASYEKYNEISMAVFLRNLQVYFARHRWPKDAKTAKEFQSLFTESMVLFSHDLYKGAEKIAVARGHAFIRDDDVDAFAQSFVPHRINEYEDAIFFPKLPAAQQVELEAYDMDSFRDGGLHWRYLQYVIEDPKFDGKLAPDPFAAEMLTENIAQFGVLLLRETGRLSKEQGHEFLRPELINLALRSIQDKINANARSSGPAEENARIQSADDNGESPHFVDKTQAAGIHHMHRMANWLGRQIRSFTMKSENVGELAIPPAFQGSGVAAEDIDNDGWPDILLLGGLGNHLYKNNGDGTFADITERAGINWLRPDGHPGESRQPIIVDFDNDGKQDILITYVNDKHRLYRNLGEGRFEDVTEKAGLGGEGLVGGPATVLDFDKDGLLDIYIGYFGDYLHGQLPTLARRNSNGMPNKLFRNKGNFQFEDVTKGSGTDDTGWAQAIGHTDIDGDGWQDIIVGNDFGVNAYLRNLGNGKFENIADRIGTGKPSYTMGIGIADLNGDSHPDIYVSNIVLMNKDEKYVVPGEETVMKFNPQKLANMRVVEANDLFISHVKDGRLEHYEHSDLVGRGYSSTGWSWGADFFDMDNDGDDDLYVVNGMNAYNVYGTGNPYYTDASGQARDVYFPSETKESNVLFMNKGGKLINVSRGSGVDLLGNSRSAAYLDYDGDGDLDIILNNFQEPAVLYRNMAERFNNHWISIRLVGDPLRQTSRDAIGAKIVVTTRSGLHVWREVHSTTGYLSAHPKEQHFGVGKQEKVNVAIEWPNGERTHFENVGVNKRYLAKQGEDRMVAVEVKDLRRSK